MSAFARSAERRTLERSRTSRDGPRKRAFGHELGEGTHCGERSESGDLTAPSLFVQGMNEDGGFYGGVAAAGLLADVRNTAFEVGGVACVVCVDCGGYLATKARDQQRGCFCRVVEGVGGVFVRLQPDPIDLVGSQRSTVKDEQ